MNSNRNGAFVPSSEAERFTLHQTLRGLMPEAVADTLMAHLPPGGWSDIARTSDIVALREATKHDIDDLRVRVDRLEVKIDKLASMKRYVVTTGIALATLIMGFGVPAIILGVQILAALN
jgi:hypothetical protein